MTRILASGHPAHTRMLEVELLAGGNDRLEVRGNIVDLRKTGFVALMNDIQGAGFVHHMQLGLRIEANSGRVEQVRVEQPYVAIEATTSTAGECCRDPIERLLALEGEHLVPGFEKQVTRLFGGPLGCSHLMTLGQTVGRSVPHAIASERAAIASTESIDRPREPGERIFKRSVFVDGLISQDGTQMELALQQCDLRSTPRALAKQTLERLDRQHEIQAHAVVRIDGLRLESLTCQERMRGLEQVGGKDWTRWHERSDEVQHLVSERIMPGLGSRLLAEFGKRDDRRVLLDALLHLGPGFLQCLAALGDDWLGEGGRPASAATLGSNRDACYMWRSGGALELGRKRDLERIASLEGDES